MWSTKDLTLIIVLAALGFVSTALIVQTAGLITGIPGINFVFTIFLAIQTSFALLYYQGRRWRFFVQMAIFYILIIPTYLGGTPFNILGKTHFLITAFITDVTINTFYRYFNKKQRLQLYSCITALLFWTIQPFVGIPLAFALYAPEYGIRLFSVVVVLLPLIIAEATAGGFIGYKIYRRTVRLNDSSSGASAHQDTTKQDNK